MIDTLPAPVPVEELRQSTDEGVLCWIQLPLWRARILEALNDVVPKAARQDFRLKDLQDRLAEDLLVERLHEVFHSIRAFHACSPVDLSSYFAEGLKPLSVASTNEKIREFYLDGRFPELTAADVDTAIADIGPKLRDGYLWFGLDDRFLVRYCGHYLLYGSEYVMAVAASLSRVRGRNYQRCLHGRGIPTVFACDIPLSSCSTGTVREFCQSIIGGIVSHRRRKHPPAIVRDHGFSLRVQLPPSNIRGHYHPKPEQIIDWHRN